MKPKVNTVTPIGTEMVLPNMSGTRKYVEIQNINPSNQTLTIHSKLILNQDQNDSALIIDSESTTNRVLYIDTPKTTTSHIIGITQANDLTTGRALSIYSASPSNATRSLAYIENNHSSATDTTLLYLRQEAQNRSLFIDQNTNSIALSIDSEATTSKCISIENSQITTGRVLDCNSSNFLTTGRIISAVSNSADTGARDLVFIRNQNTAAVNTKCLKLDQDANCSALHIDSEATTHTGCAIEIQSPATTTGNVFRIAGANALTTGRLMQLESNSADTSSRSLVSIHNNNALATGAKVLRLQQDSTGTALSIDMNGTTGNAIVIDQDSNNAGDIYAIDIVSNNAGAGNPGGINLGSFSVDEPLIKAPSDAITNPGTLSHQLAIDIGGTTYYLYAYTHGT